MTMMMMMTTEMYRLNEELIKTWQLTATGTVTLVLTRTGIITNKLHGTSKLPNVRPVLYILMQTAAINTGCIIRKFFTEQ
jgi:hypothetical protein